MRKQLLVVLAAGALALAVVGTARAQDISLVKVSFPFVVEGTVLPAGSYLVELDSLHGTVELRGQNVAAGAVVLTVPGVSVSSGSRPDVSFKKVENDYFLSEIRLPGLDARDVPLSSGMVAATLARLNAAGDRASNGTQQ